MSERQYPDPVVSTENALWDDLQVSLIKAQTGPSAPSLSTFRNGLKLYSFNKNTDQELLFDLQLPHTWLAGSQLRPHIHWSPGNNATTDVVRWGLEYSWANAVTGAFPASTTIYVEQAAAGTAYQHQIAQFPAVTGTGFKLSSILVCRLFRDADNGADTFDADAFAVSFDVHILNSTGGSTAEYPS